MNDQYEIEEHLPDVNGVKLWVPLVDADSGAVYRDECGQYAGDLARAMLKAGRTVRLVCVSRKICQIG